MNILERNDPAPFHGILIPEATLEKMSVEIWATDNMKKELDACEVEKLHQVQESKENSLLWFMSGIVAGIFGGVYLSSLHQYK